MKVRKYNARTSRDALRQVREDLGADAVILANRMVKGGVEIMAMAAADLAAQTAAGAAAAAAVQATLATQPLDVGEDDIVAAPHHVLARRAAARRHWAGLGLDDTAGRGDARSAAGERAWGADSLVATESRDESGSGSGRTARGGAGLEAREARPTGPRGQDAADLRDALFEPLPGSTLRRRDPHPAAGSSGASVAPAVRPKARRHSLLGLKPEPAPLDLPTAGTGSGAPAVLRRRPLVRLHGGDQAFLGKPEAAMAAAPAASAAAGAMRAMVGAAATQVAAPAGAGQVRPVQVNSQVPAAAGGAAPVDAHVQPAELASLAARHDPLMSALAEEVRSLGSMLGHNLGAAAAPASASLQAATPAPTPSPVGASAATPGAAPVPAGVPLAVEAVEGARQSGGEAWVRNMMGELRSMRVLIEDQIGAMAFSDAGRMPAGKARVVRLLSAAGFSAALIRKLTARMPENVGEPEAVAFVRAALRNNLSVAGSEAELLDQGGVYALVGPTGAGKTTTAAKLAARFVVRHGAENLALLTTDGYRIGGQEQLRIYGRILGVAVHAVKDAEDLRRTLGELRNRKLVLIDTVGLSQRDGMVNDQHQMFANCGVPIRRLLLLNATCHGDTLADVGRAYRSDGLAGCILTKLDEAAAPGAALDAAIRQRLRVFYSADGQRVPEDLHLADAGALIERVLKGVADLEQAKQAESDFPFELPAAMVRSTGEGEVLNG